MPSSSTAGLELAPPPRSSASTTSLEAPYLRHHATGRATTGRATTAPAYRPACQEVRSLSSKAMGAAGVPPRVLSRELTRLSLSTDQGPLQRAKDPGRRGANAMVRLWRSWRGSSSGELRPGARGRVGADAQLRRSEAYLQVVQGLWDKLRVRSGWG